MSGNKHAVNRAAINEGVLVVTTAAAALVASAVIAAPITYTHRISDSSTALSTLESSSNQTHSPSKVLYGVSSISDDGGVTKLVTTSAVTTSSVTSWVLPLGANSQFAGTASVSATIHPKYAGFSDFSADASLAVVGDVWFNAFIRGPYDIVDNSPTVEFIAAPMVKLSGESYYIHSANTYQAFPSAELTFVADGIHIFIDGWHPFGGVTFDNEPTYQHRGFSTFDAGDASISASSVFQYYDSKSMSATAVVTDTAVKTAYPTASILADANVNPITARTKHFVVTDVQADAEGINDATVVHFGTYPVVEGIAELVSTEFLYAAAIGDMAAVSTGEFTGFIWTIQQASCTGEASAVFSLAAAYVRGFDIDVIERPAEIKDLEHPEEVKEFIRELA